MQKRKHMYLILAVFFLVGPFFLTSCASSLSSQAYSRDQARQSMWVSYGTVRDVRPVRIEGTKNRTSAVAGDAILAPTLLMQTRRTLDPAQAMLHGVLSPLGPEPRANGRDPAHEVIKHGHERSEETR